MSLESVTRQLVSEPDVVLTARVPRSVIQAVDAVAARFTTTRTEVVRALLYTVTDREVWPDAPSVAMTAEVARRLQTMATEDGSAK